MKENNKKRPTVGKLVYDEMQKTPETYDPVEVEREVHKEYEDQIMQAVVDGKKKHLSDFYVVVETKKERLMHNVVRNYFFTRISCPTPIYDQTVYKYSKNSDKIEFLWVIPARDICNIMKTYSHEVQDSNKELLQYVLDFYDNTLLKKSKRLNREAADSNIIIA
jgi:hypothetical protein